MNVGFDTEIFGQQASQLFGNLVHEVKDDVRANVQERPYSEQAKIYAESQQTEEALNEMINHIWGSVTIDGQDLDEVFARPVVDFAAKLENKDL